MTPIGQVRTPWAEKFGVPRQPGLADLPATVELRGPWAVPEAIRGLEAASHLWLIFLFDRVPPGQWSPTVRPPRLGGNQRIGVFASRSPFRPNPIGLSCVAWDGHWREVPGGLDLEVRGADLVDQTPLLDLKPWLPYADHPASAHHAWAPSPPSVLDLPLEFNEPAAAQLSQHPTPDEFRKTLCATLQQDPRPPFHNDPQRIYHLKLADGWAASFLIAKEQIVIQSLQPP